jgi:hypothetical protein
MVLQSDHITLNLKLFNAMIDTLDDSSNEMSYQRLLTPIDREPCFLCARQSSSGNSSSFDVHPKLLPTSSYLVKLSASSSSSSSQLIKPISKMRKIYWSDGDQMQIGFIPDVSIIYFCINLYSLQAPQNEDYSTKNMHMFIYFVFWAQSIASQTSLYPRINCAPPYGRVGLWVME